MKGCAENPVCHLLIINHDARFGEKGDETISNAKLGGDLFAIGRSPGTPKVKLCSIGLKSSHMLNHGDYGNALCANRANERVIDINVNDHGIRDRD